MEKAQGLQCETYPFTKLSFASIDTKYALGGGHFFLDFAFIKYRLFLHDYEMKLRTLTLRLYNFLGHQYISQAAV